MRDPGERVRLRRDSRGHVSVEDPEDRRAPHEKGGLQDLGVVRAVVVRSLREVPARGFRLT
jgi:hypothetical protein